MKPSLLASLQGYFDQAAPHYEEIEPAFAPLVDGLIALAAPEAPQRVLDLGTGSGLAARRCGGLSRFVCGLDFSHQMLLMSRRYGLGNLLQSDSHRLALGSGTFDVVLASFALNSGDPSRSLPEVLRVLTPGGWLALQEWAAPDPLSELVSDTVASYAVDDPPPELAAMRKVMETSVPWDDLETPEDVATLVNQVGFTSVEMTLDRPAVRLTDVEAFVRYKLSWPNRRAEMRAMPEETRRLCLSDLGENLTAHAEPDGSLLWQPELIRICARKPAA